MCLFYKDAGAKKEKQGTYSVGKGGVNADSYEVMILHS